MAKQKEEQSTLTICKTPGWENHKIILEGIEQDRTDKFNKGESISVTEEELKAIGKIHRWLEVK